MTSLIISENEIYYFLHHPCLITAQMEATVARCSTVHPGFIASSVRAYHRYPETSWSDEQVGYSGIAEIYYTRGCAAEPYLLTTNNTHSLAKDS